MNKFICAAAVTAICMGFSVASRADMDNMHQGMMQQGTTMQQGAMQQGSMPQDKMGMMHKDMMDKDHPAEIHMAIEKLEHTKTDLQKAGDDWGGHRMEALKHVDEALAELHKAEDMLHGGQGKDMHDMNQQGMDHHDMH
jgi:hypothetical protein